MTFCGIVSKQFKKYLTLHVDNSKQKNMAQRNDNDLRQAQKNGRGLDRLTIIKACTD
jgi:hypothetical protein